MKQHQIIRNEVTGLEIRRFVYPGNENRIEFRFDKTGPDRVARISIDQKTRKQFKIDYFTEEDANKDMESLLQMGYHQLDIELDTEPYKESPVIMTITQLDQTFGDELDVIGCTINLRY